MPPPLVNLAPALDLAATPVLPLDGLAACWLPIWLLPLFLKKASSVPCCGLAAARPVKGSSSSLSWTARSLQHNAA